MHLVIFDIDGTLIHSHKNEADCFERALTKIMGVSNVSKDLETYEHVSDHGILNECIYRALGRLPTASELDKIEEEFIHQFTQVLAHVPPTPIPGVRSLFNELAEEEDVALAIATGCYLRSARLKFTHSNLPFHHLPIGTSNDSAIRTNIMQTAHHRARDTYNITEFDSVTYIGDGPWDVRAVQALQWNFIGIASNYSEERLKTLGAKHVIKDYACTDSFFHHLYSQHG